MMNKLYLLAILVLVVQRSFGQQVSGHIKSLEGDPLESATILNTTTKSHTHAGSGGLFLLSNTSIGDTLSVSYVGFESVQIVVREIQSLEIHLKSSEIELSQVVITPSLSTLSSISKVDLGINPLNSAQEVLRKIPGLFIAQHAGGGKAEQIFLRGFDIDHGTDIQITADDIPVNMVSHAHGQGYADLHFLIPETVEKIDFGKGTYYADKGNFSTAGYVNFQTFNKLDQSSVKLEGGKFNTKRIVGMLDLLESESGDAYLASEYMYSDGPFNSPQGLSRVNVFGKYSSRIKNSYLMLQGSTFSSRWDASGQIPERAVSSGLISRFGAIDDTEGGATSRSSLGANLKTALNETSFTETSMYFVNYDFELYSNFTFFLNDPLNGDQIRQKESRSIYGLKTMYSRTFSFGKNSLTTETGVGLRTDEVGGNELSHTVGRFTRLDTLALGDIQETNLSGYTDLKFNSGPWLLNAGLRVDQFQFDYTDHTAPTYHHMSISKSTLSPKFNISYSHTRAWQVYLKSGKSFHSNDTRTITASTSNSILPAAWGADLGGIFNPVDNLYINLACWYLYLQQEFVYVGDEGIVEPSGKTTRKGIDIGLNYQMRSWLYADFSWNFTNPKAIDEPEVQNKIPLAPSLTSIGGLTARTKSGVSGSIRYRLLGDRPANEDNSLVASGYTLVDMAATYTRGSWSMGLIAQNVLNTRWKEAQFETESQLQGESEPITEIHFTPGSPFFIKLSSEFRF